MKCAVNGCKDQATKRGITCGPVHAQVLRQTPSKKMADKPVVVQETVTIEEEFRLKKQVKNLKSELENAASKLSEKLMLGGFFQAMLSEPMPAPPAWIANHKPKLGQAIPTAFLSDTHFGEVVEPEEVEWGNAYNREIAGLRLKNFFNNTVLLARDYITGISYPGIVMPLGGDIFSGDIHEELQKTNEGTLIEEILYWIDPMVSGIKMMANEFGKVMIPCVVGNHPRNSRKPIAKMRIPNNFDWMFYCLLKRVFDGDSKYNKKIDWKISRAADVDYRIYNTGYRLSHGDQFRGGSGISGLMAPLMIGDARKRKRAVRQKNPYDYLVLAHWHQRAAFKGIIVNGSLKGTDEYAYVSNFDPEPPEQSFWLTDQEHGITIQAPIHVIDKSEYWLKSQ